MISRVFIVLRKELARFFGDRRLVFTTLILPGLMIYILYSFMGDAMQNMAGESTDPSSMEIYTSGMPFELKAWLDLNTPLSFHEIAYSDVGVYKEKVEALDGADLLAVFPLGFEDAIADDDEPAPFMGLAPGFVKEPEALVPDAELYFNSSSDSSYAAYQIFSAGLNAFEESKTNLFTVNSGAGPYDLASEEGAFGMVLSMLMPLLLTVFLFSSCAALAPESIAGEKERGTIAALLVTPIGRGELAVGKILSLAITSFLCGLSSTTGTLLSLPKMLPDEMAFGATAYTLADYALVALVTASTVLVFVSAMSIVSAFAKTIKEAQTAIAPFMIAVILVSLSSVLSTASGAEAYRFFIPVYNSIQCLREIFAYHMDIRHILFTASANVSVAILGAFVLSRMFHSEKVVFTR